MGAVIWHNGDFIEDGPVLSIHDRMRLGEAVFNTMLAIDGKIIHPRRHFEKLIANSKILIGSWDAPQIENLQSAGEDLLASNDLNKGRASINTIITGGPGGGGLKEPAARDVQMMMRALPCPEKFPPIEAVIVRSVRRNEGSPLSQMKCAHYGDHILALREAQSRGGNEAILLNNRGDVVCASVANIVIVKEGKLYTPPLSDGAQNGLTRQILMEKYDVVEKSISVKDLQTAHGIYLTNSLRGAMAVQTLDGQTLEPPAVIIDKDFHLS